IFLPDVIVHTSHSIVANGVAGFYAIENEVARRIAQAIRQWNQLQNVQRDRTEAAGWHGIVGERLPGKRVDYARTEHAVPLAFREDSAHRRIARCRLAKPFIVAEEKQFVVNDRASQGAAELIPLEGILAIGKERARVKLIVAEKLVKRTAQGIGAALRH